MVCAGNEAASPQEECQRAPPLTDTTSQSGTCTPPRPLCGRGLARGCPAGTAPRPSALHTRRWRGRTWDRAGRAAGRASVGGARNERSQWNGPLVLLLTIEPTLVRRPCSGRRGGRARARSAQGSFRDQKRTRRIARWGRCLPRRPGLAPRSASPSRAAALHLGWTARGPRLIRSAHAF